MSPRVVEVSGDDVAFAAGPFEGLDTNISETSLLCVWGLRRARLTVPYQISFGNSEIATG